MSIYVEAYEARQRDPIIDHVNRASVANGKMNRWQRYTKQPLVWVDDAEGHPRALTPTQLRVYELAASMVDTKMYTMREMAARLSVSPSTVSRAMTKLAAWGILVYIVGRGRFAGLVVIRYAKGSIFEPLRKAARERVYRWKLAAEARISRLAVNVAPYILGGVEGVFSPNTPTYYKGATLTVQRSWTAEEIEDALA